MGNSISQSLLPARRTPAIADPTELVAYPITPRRVEDMPAAEAPPAGPGAPPVENLWLHQALLGGVGGADGEQGGQAAPSLHLAAFKGNGQAMRDGLAAGDGVNLLQARDHRGERYS